MKIFWCLEVCAADDKVWWAVPCEMDLIYLYSVLYSFWNNTKITEIKYQSSSSSSSVALQSNADFGLLTFQVF
jgi:hypothetical protein